MISQLVTKTLESVEDWQPPSSQVSRLYLQPNMVITAQSTQNYRMLRIGFNAHVCIDLKQIANKIPSPWSWMSWLSLNRNLVVSVLAFCRYEPFKFVVIWTLFCPRYGHFRFCPDFGFRWKLSISFLFSTSEMRPHLQKSTSQLTQVV